MNKEFIPYEIALALKELGFDEPCIATIDQTEYLHIKGTKKQPRGSMMYDTIDAPLYQQAFRWFRDNYGLQAEILWRGDMGCFCYKTGKFKYGSHDFSKDDYETYEEAELACLKKLIEIVKEKQ
jgi:hypothetical protein